MAIRYDKKLTNEINKVVRNFNSKINRLEKLQNDLLLPDKISKKSLTEEYYTRKDLQRKLNELKRFSTRGIEKTITTKSGLKLSEYELINLKKESARVKRNLTREIKNLRSTKPKVFGKVQTATFAQMGDNLYLNLLARREALEKGNIENLTKEEYESFKKLVRKTAKNKQYMNSVFKDNYKKMLTDLGYYYNYDKDKMQVLEKRLDKLNSNEFLKLFQNDKSIKAIIDYYPIITDTLSSINPKDIQDDVKVLYDNLIDNIDDILENYKL